MSNRIKVPMRSLIVSVGVILLGMASTPVLAQVDCEPARCAVQQAIDQNCSCSTAINHGQYVSCVTHQVNQLSKAGLIPTNCKGKITRSAARSICGKPGFVVCDIPEFGICNLVTGACTEGTLLPGHTTCAANSDCLVGTLCKTKSSTDLCTAKGGTVDSTATTCSPKCPGP